MGLESIVQKVVGGATSVAKVPVKAGASVVSGVAKGLGVNKLLSQIDKQLHKPGVAGALGDLATAVSGDDSSWQARLGQIVSAAETAKVFDKHRKNIEKIIAGGDEAKDVTGTTGLNMLETARLTPQMQQQGIQDIIAGRKLEQEDRSLDLSERGVEVQEGKLTLEQLQAGQRADLTEAQINQLNSYAGYLDFKAQGGDENKRTQIIMRPTESGKERMELVNSETGETIKVMSGEVDKYKDTTAQQQQTQRMSVIRQASNLAARDIAQQGFGDLISDAFGNVTVRFKNPVEGQQALNQATKRWMTSIASDLGIPMSDMSATLNMLSGGQNVIPSVNKSVNAEDEASDLLK